MRESNTGRRTLAEIALGGTDISSSIRPYLLSISYTDNEEDQTDSLTIQLQDRAGGWLNQRLADMVNKASTLVDDPDAPKSQNPQTDAGTTPYIVTVHSSLNVRSGPSTGNSKIGELANGTRVSVQSISGNWAKLDYNGQEAYVSANYLQAANGTTSTAAAPAMQTVTGGRMVQAEFTAYYPADNPMEGGKFAANGERLDPSKQTCAVPRSVPLGTSITVQGTGTACDGRIYQANDYGGAIVVKNGVYCIDLLMSSHTECMNFGRRRGTAIIGGKITTTATKTTTKKESTSSQSGTAAAFLAVARQEIGVTEKGYNNTKYGEWAGNNPAPWCVYYISWCAYYAKAPIPTKYGAVSEMSAYFKSKGLYRSASSGYIPKPGDLMVQGTRHIGIVEKADSSGVWTIEGNCPDCVKRMKRRYSEISGFCTPKFADSGTKATTTSTSTTTTTSGSVEKPRDNTLPAGKKSALTIQAAFVQQNWSGDGKDTLLDCGEFELDSISESFPPMTVTIKATSLPYRSTVRQTEKSRAWESLSLSAIANQIAQENQMLCLFESETDPLFTRVEQFKMSDIAFLSKLCKDAGISLKATNHMLVLFHQATYEAKEPAFSFTYGDGSYLSFKGNIGKSDTSYTMCRVYSFDPETKKTIEGFAYVTDYQKDKANNQLLELQAKVSSIAEAQKLAQVQLRLHNKYAKTCTLTLVGNPQIVSGMVVELKKWGLWTGKYMVKQAVHTLNSSGYVTKITLRYVLEGY